MYRIFTRRWWKENPSYPNGLEPSPGRKNYIKDVKTFQEARDFCQEWNATHDPGRLSVKAEFEKVGG